MSTVYEVIVGNIGTVYTGPDKEKAMDIYDAYVALSQGGYGRASGEGVTFMEDGDPIAEFSGRPVNPNPMRYLLVDSGNAEEVAKYLPNNYKAISASNETVIVAGQDHAGWTLDGYAIPRLGSGWISSEELVDNKSKP